MGIRVADYIAEFVKKTLKVDTVFMVSGGGMMFLSDGVALSDLKVVCNHHEQASAMGAVGYAKYSGNYGVAYITTGCGGTNALTGLLNAYQDNSPCIFISGQVKKKETSRNSGLKLRQFGVQEADIIPVVESLAKYSVMVNEPNKIAYHLEKAAYLAKSGRPGPVWLDIPMDVQSAEININELKHFDQTEYLQNPLVPSKEDYSYVINALEKAQRPIIVAGQGIRLGAAIGEFKQFIESNDIPYVASRLGIDLLPSDHPLFIGRIGNKGDRAGNFAVQNADLVIALGSRLSVSSTGHQYELFAREADIIVIDIDEVEHKKNTVKIDKFIHADVKDFFNKFPSDKKKGYAEWKKKCLHWKTKWPVCLPEYKNEKRGINLYYFTDILSELAPDNAVFVSDAGSAFYVVSQGGQFKEGQRYVTSGGQAEMGYSLPAAIGVAAANMDANVLAITGDGSLQMNIQEIQTMLHYQMPVKLFVWNNDGYLSIRASQRKFFDSRFIGTDKTSGVSFPELEKLANAYGVKYFSSSSADTLAEILTDVINEKGPVICEIFCIRDQEIVPAASSMTKEDGTMVSKPLEDMYPFLDREEFNTEMIVKQLEE